MTYPSGTAVLAKLSIGSTTENRRQAMALQDQSPNRVTGYLSNKRARRFARTQQHPKALEAFEQMLETSREKFVAMAYSVLRNKEDAEDAVQNAFLSAYLHLGAFEGRAALKTWFTRIVLNAAGMIRRQRKPGRFVSLDEPDSPRALNFCERIAALEPDPEQAYADGETLQKVNTVVQKMRPKLRQAFDMAYYSQLSRCEASRSLGISAATFKGRVFRARRLVITRVISSPKKSMAFSRLRDDYRCSTLDNTSPSAAGALS